MGIAILMGGAALYFSLTGNNNESGKVAYIDIKEVFEGFQMKKELQTKFEGTANARKLMLDSLGMQVKRLSMQIEGEKNPSKDLMIEFELKREEYFKKRDEFAESNSQMSAEYDQQILEQLSQYVKDFGKENKYVFIYGATEAGNIMYGEENANITKEVISYINKRYSGKK
jgi:outer membrane protein